MFSELNEILPVGSFQLNRVAFRAWEVCDIPFLYRWLNDPEIVSHLGEPYPIQSKESLIQYYEKRKSQPYRFMVLNLEDDNRSIGTCRLFNLDWKSRRCELAIMIGEKSLWGEGFGTDCVELLKNIAFLGLGMNRLELHCFSNNKRAINLYKKCKFVIDGTLRQYQLMNGVYQDVLIMSLLAHEYHAQP